MTDEPSWGREAEALLAASLVTHSATRSIDNALVRAGGIAGIAMLLSLTVEFALKALLAEEGKTHRIHNLAGLYDRLSTAAQRNAARVYAELVQAEHDERVHKAPVDRLETCLGAHDDAFTKWRYDVSNADRLYPAPLWYVAVSLLTFAHPDRTYVVGSATSHQTEVTGGKTKRTSGPPGILPPDDFAQFFHIGVRG